MKVAIQFNDKVLLNSSMELSWAVSVLRSILNDESAFNQLYAPLLSAFGTADGHRVIVEWSSAVSEIVISVAGVLTHAAVAPASCIRNSQMLSWAKPFDPSKPTQRHIWVCGPYFAAVRITGKSSDASNAFMLSLLVGFLHEVTHLLTPTLCRVSDREWNESQSITTDCGFILERALFGGLFVHRYDLPVSNVLQDHIASSELSYILQVGGEHADGQFSRRLLPPAVINTAVNNLSSWSKHQRYWCMPKQFPSFGIAFDELVELDPTVLKNPEVEPRLDVFHHATLQIPVRRQEVVSAPAGGYFKV